MKYTLRYVDAQTQEARGLPPHRMAVHVRLGVWVGNITYKFHARE